MSELGTREDALSQNNILNSPESQVTDYAERVLVDADAQELNEVSRREALQMLQNIKYVGPVVVEKRRASVYSGNNGAEARFGLK